MMRLLVGGTMVVAVATSGFVGFALGERQGFMRGMRLLEGHIAGVLSLDVEVASSVRTEDAKRALQLLDLQIDGSVLSLTAARANLGFLVVEGQGIRPDEALGQAKLYRGVVPAVGRDAAAVTSALQGVRAGSTSPPALAELKRRIEG